MRNFIMIFMIVITTMLVWSPSQSKAEWTDYTENGVVFPDIVFSQYEQPRTVGGINHICTLTMAYIWQKETVAGITESCLPETVAGGGDTNYNTTNNTTNETTNTEITENCKGCPSIVHEFKKVKKHKFKTIQ